MITATSLTKRYRRVAAVDGVTFTCEPGTITGFLGRNGAGKSTTLRMITGLTRPDAGRATVAGKPFADLPNPARTVGTLLDAAAFHDGRTGRETLVRLTVGLAGTNVITPSILAAETRLRGPAGGAAHRAAPDRDARKPIIPRGRPVGGRQASLAVRPGR